MRGIETVDRRNPEQDRDPDHADPQLEEGIDAERMAAGGHEPGQKKAAQA